MVSDPGPSNAVPNTEDSRGGLLAQLLPQHAALLTASAISEEIAQARGYRSLEQKARLTELGFSPTQARVPALLIPIWNVGGEIALYQARADEPRIVDGKAVKYETPRGSRMVLDVPPACRSNLGNPSVPLFVTEGVRKADAAASIGLCCIDVIGVWSWRGTNEVGGKIALVDWDSIALNDRLIYIVFDSDVMTKIGVYQALARLKAFLESRHAHVQLIYLPSEPDGAKVGLDDYLGAGHGADDLLALATTELRPAPSPDAQAGSPYRETPAGLVWDKPTANGTVATPLTNFRARIVAEVVEDDGAERRRLFEIEGAVGGREASFRLPATVFNAMNWPTEQLGANAVIYAGMGLRDHAKVAIQLLSGETPERMVYTHTGWREIGDEWVYLHGGGAIGPLGPVGEGIETHLEGALARYVLPDPPIGAALQTTVRASLGLLDVAPDRVSVPLLAATYRAALGGPDFSVHISGPTGVLKTELAALVQQHFGAAMDSRNLPGSWSSTANALEAVAFAAKDAVFVVDDFAPAGSATDVLRLHRDADRVLRAQGNSAGRGRMRADTTLRQPKPPRGLVVSTGEDVPRGQSLRARLFGLEVNPGDVDPKRLSLCQADAAAGLYSKAMAGFIGSIADRYGDVRAGLREEVVRLRGQTLGSRAHRRTPEIVANLAIGIDHFLTFAEAVGAIEPPQHVALSKRCWLALEQAASGQDEHQSANEPTTRFIELLASAISNGRAHVAGEDGGAPPNPGAWGWRMETSGSGTFQGEVWRPGRERVGWLVENDLFLDPDASFAAAQSMGRDTGDPLAAQPKTLHRRLGQAGLLLSVDEERRRLTVRRTLGGARRYVLHLDASVLERAVQPAQPARPVSEPEGSGPFPRADVVAPVDPIGPQDASEAAPVERGSIPIGPNGPIGSVSTGRDDPLDDGISLVSIPADGPEPSEDQLIGLVREQLSTGLRDHASVWISSGEKIVDLELAARRWLAELEHPGWIGSVARDKLVRLGRALLNDGAGA
ncbi:MAG: DUF3854 domain-containing protein [Candidatus Limnocylindrales bacterium]